MLRAAMIVMTATFTLTGAKADAVRVLVSNVAGARAYDPVVGPGYVVLPAPHADLNVVWNATTQTFSGGFRTDSDVSGGGAFVQFGPEDAIAYLPSTGQRQRTNAGAQYDFQGAMGDTFWLYPSSSTPSNNAFTLYLGFSAYGVARNGTFTNDRIRWTVHSVENLTTPAATAFYGYSVSASTVNMQLTLDPAYPNREMLLLANGHGHLNLLFKSAGMYRVTFRVRGTLAATGQEVSSLVPVYFGVEQWQIPAAAAPAIALSGNIAFGNITVGQTATRTLTISNTGNAALNVSSISYPSGFSGNWNNGNIAAGSSTNVTVTFAPNAATNFSGNITVNSDATSGTNTIAASGTGTPAPTRIVTLAGNLAFGNVTVGQSATRTLTISNSGNAALNVSSISYPAGFSGNWNNGNIAAGSSTNVTVSFAPNAATNFSGNITVNSDATSGINTIAANGSGLAPWVTVLSPGQPTFNGLQTSMNVRMQSSPNTALNFLFTGSLSDPATWFTNNAPQNSGPTGEFDATFTAPGNHTNQWSSQMFFRLRY
jgi:surface-anchored protein